MASTTTRLLTRSMLALPRWVVKGLTRLHLREDAQAGPKAEELLVEIRDILKAQTASHHAAELTKFSARRLARRPRLRATQGERRHATFRIAAGGSAVPRLRRGMGG